MQHKGRYVTPHSTAKIGLIVTLSLQSLSAQYRQHILSFPAFAQAHPSWFLPIETLKTAFS